MTKKKALFEIFSRWQKQNPKPTTELIYQSEYQLLVAVILSAQSTDKAVNQVTKNLFTLAPTPEKMLTLSILEVKTCINRLGLHQQKAHAIWNMSKILVEQYQSRIPQDRKALEALPGVGRKTANVILNTAFKIPVIAVDTHIFRLSHRLNFSQGKTPKAVEDDLMKIIPKEFLLDAHHWMILHGRYVCQAKKPRCEDCSIQDLCPFFRAKLKKV